MITINIGPVTSHIEDVSPGTSQVIYENMSLKDPTAKYSDKFRKGLWDGFVHFYKPIRHSFPTGFLFMIKNILEDRRESYRIIQQQKRPERKYNWEYFHGNLRDCQKKAVEIGKKEGRGLLWLAVDAGKTRIAAKIIQELGLNALYLVHRQDLLAQVHNDLENHLGFSVGVVGAGITQPGIVTVASIQSLCVFYKELKKSTKAKGTKTKEAKEKNDRMRAIGDCLDSADVLILDECHLHSAEEWIKIVNHCNAYYRIGMSGTVTGMKSDPIRDMRLVGITGPVIQKITHRELVDMGYSTPIKCIVHKIISPFIPINDYFITVQAGIINYKQRNKLVADTAFADYKKGHTVLIFTQQIKHAEILRDIIRENYGVNPLFVHGGVPIKDRLTIKQAMIEEHERLVISTSVFKLGINIPSISSIVLAHEGESDKASMQAVGRGVRLWASKKEIIVHDFYDVGNKWLERHSKRRLRLWKREGTVEIIEPQI